MAQREIRALLERAIDELPEAFRGVVVARLVEGMSVEETAERPCQTKSGPMHPVCVWRDKSEFQVRIRP